jgi:hypothetical protein
MSAFEQTVNVLIKFIGLFLNEHVIHESILLHNALSVLNHVACSVDGQEKLFIGRAGAIEVKSLVYMLIIFKESIFCFRLL